MRPFADLADIVRTDEPMALHTSFGVGGTVRYFLEPRDWADVERIYERGWGSGLRLRVLGRGCNTLVADGAHEWAVVATAGLDWCRREGRLLEVGAGLSLRRLVGRAERWGLGGIETLAGIPGSVGGAVAMNAGGRYGSTGDRLVSALVATPGHGLRSVPAPELGLTYRGSSLVGCEAFLLSATFELEPASLDALRARRRAIVAEKRAAQPMNARSAGCIFKNPPGESAGRLIDRAGLKGAQVGGAAVSRKHANFIVNRGDATATDILALIELVRGRVRGTFGVRLELEIEVWTDDDERSGYGRA